MWRYEYAGDETIIITFKKNLMKKQEDEKMRKRVMAALLILVLALTSGTWRSNQVSAANTVNGEEQEIPEGYTPIYDIADLYAIRNNPESNYILMNDIDMTEDTSEGGDYDCGTGWDSIETFNGILDGNGHRIIGMHIFGKFIQESNITYSGLFEKLQGGFVIKNLGLVNCDINITLCEQIQHYIGSIAGMCFSGRIENCYSSGNITLQRTNGSGNIYIGGLAGMMFSTVENCYNLCEIDCTQADKYYLGGICGYAAEGTINQCYNVGNMQGEPQGDASMGALMGYVQSSWRNNNCCYLKGTASQGKGNEADNADCVSLTETQMKNPKLFTGYDFEEIWETDPYCSYQYPQLKDNRMIKITSINILKAPQKLTYKQGEAIQLDNAAIEINYEDGIKTSITLTQDMLSGYDMMQIGTQQVNISYGGQETSFEIEVQEIPVSSITIPEELSIYRSKEYQLIPTVLPENASDKSVDWKSSDPAVISVDRNGLVKAKAAGTAVVTATASNGLKAECAVTVLVPAVSIQISQTALNLKAGESRSITAQALPLESTDAVKWRSGNTAVAEVYEGTVIAKNVGTAVITAYTDSGAQASCTVTVTGSSTSQNNGSGNQQGGNPGASSGSNADLIRKTASAKAKIKSAKNTSSKMIKIKLSGLNGFDGYQLQYGLKKNFRGAKTIARKSSSITVKKLKLKKTYYVRARVYKKIAGNTYYGKWSGRKSVKIKK